MATAPTKEEIESKVNKTDYIREAFAKLGLKASAQDVAAYIKQHKGEAIKANYIYVIKNKIVNPNKSKKAAPQFSKAISVGKGARKQGASSASIQGGQFTEICGNIRKLISYFGSKNELVEAINAI